MVIIKSIIMTINGRTFIDLQIQVIFLTQIICNCLFVPIFLHDQGTCSLMVILSV